VNLKPFTGPGSTASRRSFWDKVTAAVNASQKVPGSNVSVDEHPGMGTVINVDRVRHTISGSCSDAITIDVSFSGITLCEGCLDATPFGFGYSINNLTATGIINDTFTLTSFGSPLCDGSIGWFYITDNRINYDIYFTDSCAGDPTNQDDGFIVYAKCLDGIIELWLLGTSNSTVLFYATGITDLTDVPNTTVCASIVPDPNDACFPDTNDFVIASGGTATITI